MLAAKIAVTAPTTATVISAASLAKKSGYTFATKYTPAATMVAA